MTRDEFPSPLVQRRQHADVDVLEQMLEIAWPSGWSTGVPYPDR